MGTICDNVTALFDAAGWEGGLKEKEEAYTSDAGTPIAAFRTYWCGSRARMGPLM